MKNYSAKLYLICRSLLSGKTFEPFVSLSSYFPHLHKMNASVMPPNVLVYTGGNEPKVFKSIADNLLKCLHRDMYVVYELQKAQVLKTPWKENAALLVILCDEIEDSIAETFSDYFEKDGKMLVICSNLAVPRVQLNCQATSKDSLIKIQYKNEVNTVWHGKYSFSFSNRCLATLATDADNKPVIGKVSQGNGVLVVSEVYLASYPTDSQPSETGNLGFDAEKQVEILKSILDEDLGLQVSSSIVPKPTSGYVIVEDGKDSDLTIQEISLGKLDLEETGGDTFIDLKVPLIFEDNQEASLIPFDKSTYFARLKTKKFGRTVVFFPVVTSTMIPADHLSDQEGIAVIALQQISGRGRGDNVWISPKGCAMFTLHFTLSLTSQVGQRLSVLQHMVTLAVVNSIKKLPSYNKLELRVKWPNDIYFEKDKKIGGVLVNTTIQGNLVHLYIGVGVNVSNRCPTVCINSIIDAHNQANSDNLPLLKIEEVIASTLTELERLIDDFEKSGPDNFLSLYYSYWLHKDQQVVLESRNEQGIVRSLDDYGFLVVQTNDGKLLTLQPDGNRFDMMKNLIVTKE